MRRPCPRRHRCITPQFFYDGANWQYLNNTAATTGGTYDSMTWSATPTFAVNPYYFFALTLTGNVTSSNVTGSVAGQVIGIYLCQDSTGGRSFVWPTSFVNPPNLPQAASARRASSSTGQTGAC